jgi:hypothetical protein
METFGSKIADLLSSEHFVGFVLDNVKAVAKIRTDAELADVLGVPTSTVSTWRKRKTVPYKEVALFCVVNEVPLEVVLFGDSPASVQPQSSEPDANIVDNLEGSNMRVVPELLTAAMEAAELVPSSQRPNVVMKVYTLAYTGVPDQAAMSRITASDLAPLVDFVRKYEKPRAKSGPPNTGRLAQARVITDKEMPPRTPLSQQKKKKG